MQKFNRGLPAAFASRARKFGAGALAVVGSVFSLSAFAATTLGQTAATAIGGAESEIGLVQAALIGLLVLLVIFMFVKRSMGK